MALKRFIYFFSGFVLLLFLSACSTIYIPSMPSIPLLEEKGDAQVEFSASTNSLRLSGNYAFSKRFALMLNGNLSYKNFTNRYDIFTKEDFVESSSMWDLTKPGEFAHKYAELGFGWYNIFKTPHLFKKKLLFEVFGGMGYGHATDQKWDSPLQYGAKYYKGFIQPNIGLSFNKFAFGWGLRVAASFYNYNYQTHSNYGHQNDRILTNFTSFSMFSIEPMGMIRFGNEQLKFIYQYGLSLSYLMQSLDGLDAGKGITDGNLNTTLLHFSVGIHYSFGKRKKNKQTSE